MKKMEYKKPLVEVLDIEAEDILTTSTIDGTRSISLNDGSGLAIENGVVVVDTTTE